MEAEVLVLTVIGSLSGVLLVILVFIVRKVLLLKRHLTEDDDFTEHAAKSKLLKTGGEVIHKNVEFNPIVRTAIIHPQLDHNDPMEITCHDATTSRCHDVTTSRQNKRLEFAKSRRKFSSLPDLRRERSSSIASSVASEEDLVFPGAHITCTEPSSKLEVSIDPFIKTKNHLTNGKIKFTTQYFGLQDLLDIHIHKAFEFNPKSYSGTFKTFVCVYLEPGKRQKTHTKKVFGREPLFNEKIQLHVSPNCLDKYRLKLKLCFKRRNSFNNEHLGHVEMILKDIDRHGAKQTFLTELLMMNKQ